MDYRLYRKMRLQFGSGKVESTCENVVAPGIKQSGMPHLRACLKSRRLRHDRERLLPLSPPQETELMAG